jgi:phospholipid/cholesterol/gamma-HCH transport system substrate-binding protein
MRSRTLREGSVGLLLLVGLGVFGIVILWLNRFTGNGNSYKVILEFANAGGMQKGATVRYRGVKIGRISKIQPGPNNVDVEVEIAQPELVIPKDVIIEANQVGLISETIIDITPTKSLSEGAVVAKALNKKCDPSIILCDGSRLKGQIGISYDNLIRSSTEAANKISDQKFFNNVNKTLENASLAATGVAVLSRDLQVLSKSAQAQLGSFSTTANTVQRATNQLTASATKTADQLGTTASDFSNTAKAFGGTAKDLSSTANQAGRLMTNLDNLVTTNRSSLTTALNSISKTSDQLRTTVSSLSPAVNRLTQGELLQNLEALSANAAQASANLRDASKSLNDPKNVVVLQQTLDSARVTFENTQKITSDLDELTGDPAFRKNLRQLVNGLSTLVSSTQDMQQQVQVADTLDSLKAQAALANKQNRAIAPRESQKFTAVPLPYPIFKSSAKKLETTVKLPATDVSQERLLRQLREYGEQRKQGNGEQGGFALTTDNPKSDH